MQSIRLGVIFDQTIKSVGGYNQALNSALLVKELPTELVQVIFFTTFRENLSILNKHGIQAKLIDFSVFDKVRNKLHEKNLNKIFFKLIKKIGKYSPLEKILMKNQIDLVYFLSPTSLPRSLEKINFITTQWDSCHRDNPEFPEVRWNYELERRDENCKQIFPRATAIIVDSDAGKKNIAHRYGVDLKRIYAIPFQPSKTISSRIEDMTNKKFDIPKKFNIDKYVFYPAQFWAHKNHVYLLEGLFLLEKKYGLKISAIFSGLDKGNKKHVENYARNLKLDDRIHYTGFVDDDELIEMYRQSIALVMPSYFGPTNLPPLEAFQLGVPVLYSDQPGLRDQVGNAALLMDLKDPNSMALHIKNLLDKKQIRAQLIEAGYERLKYFDSYNRSEVLKNIIEDFRYRRVCWE